MNSPMGEERREGEGNYAYFSVSPPHPPHSRYVLDSPSCLFVSLSNVNFQTSINQT
jgi:hypothetical protein